MRQYLCFKCGLTCKTIYIFGKELDKDRFQRVESVAKECRSCGWRSHPTKLPGALQ